MIWMLLAILILIFLVPGQNTTTVFVAIFFGMQWVASFGLWPGGPSSWEGWEAGWCHSRAEGQNKMGGAWPLGTVTHRQVSGMMCFYLGLTGEGLPPCSSCSLFLWVMCHNLWHPNKITGMQPFWETMETMDSRNITLMTFICVWVCCLWWLCWWWWWCWMMCLGFPGFHGIPTQ